MWNLASRFNIRPSRPLKDVQLSTTTHDWLIPAKESSFGINRDTEVASRGLGRESSFKDYFHSFGIYFCHLIRNSYFPSFALEQTVDNMMKRKGLFENMAKDRKVIPDPIDDRKFQEWKENRKTSRAASEINHSLWSINEYLFRPQ